MSVVIGQNNYAESSTAEYRYNPALDMSAGIKVLICDDHAVVRAGLEAILSYESDIEVVGTASDGMETVRKASSLAPDVVMMDLMMPGMNGVEATGAIRKTLPDVRILILTSFGSSDEIGRALEEGASGAIVKTVSNETLVEAIRKVSAGKRVVTPELDKMLRSSRDVPILSPRQREILHSVTCGFTNREIASQFGISVSCVKRHLEGIFQKLGATTRSEAVAIALRNRLLKF